jgi:hypothetical protein
MPLVSKVGSGHLNLLFQGLGWNPALRQLFGVTSFSLDSFEDLLRDRGGCSSVPTRLDAQWSVQDSRVYVG